MINTFLTWAQRFDNVWSALLRSATWLTHAVGTSSPRHLAHAPVTNQQLLAWMQNPVPASQLGSLPAFGCSRPVVDPALKICNGIQQNEAGLLANCPFADFPWVRSVTADRADPPDDLLRLSSPAADTCQPRARAGLALGRRVASLPSAQQLLDGVLRPDRVREPALAMGLTSQQQVHLLGQLVRVRRLIPSDRYACRALAPLTMQARTAPASCRAAVPAPTRHPRYPNRRNTRLSAPPLEPSLRCSPSPPLSSSSSSAEANSPSSCQFVPSHICIHSLRPIDAASCAATRRASVVVERIAQETQAGRARCAISDVQLAESRKTEALGLKFFEADELQRGLLRRKMRQQLLIRHPDARTASLCDELRSGGASAPHAPPQRPVRHPRIPACAFSPRPSTVRAVPPRARKCRAQACRACRARRACPP